MPELWQVFFRGCFEKMDMCFSAHGTIALFPCKWFQSRREVCIIAFHRINSNSTNLVIDQLQLQLIEFRPAAVEQQGEGLRVPIRSGVTQPGTWHILRFTNGVSPLHELPGHCTRMMLIRITKIAFLKKNSLSTNSLQVVCFIWSGFVYFGAFKSHHSNLSPVASGLQFA